LSADRFFPSSDRTWYPAFVLMIMAGRDANALQRRRQEVDLLPEKRDLVRLRLKKPAVQIDEEPDRVVDRRRSRHDATADSIARVCARRTAETSVIVFATGIPASTAAWIEIFIISAYLTNSIR